MEDVLLRIEEAAKVLRLSRAKAYSMAQRGELPVVRIGRAVRVPAAALQRWVQQHTQNDVKPASLATVR